MNQAATIKFNGDSTPKRGSGGKFFIGLFAFTVAFVGLSYAFYFRHGPLPSPATARSSVPVTTTTPTPATPASPANLPKADNQPTVANDQPAPMSQPVAAVKSAVASVAGSLAAAVSPSAKAVTVQQPSPTVSQPVAAAALPAKRIVNETPAAHALLNAEQKRLQVAQKSFDHVMDMAVQHPDTYGFRSDDEFGDAKLGDAIPLYTIKLQGKDKFATPLSSLLQPSDAWLYPIILAGHVRYFVQVKFDGQNYVPGDGSRALGATYDKILAQWPPDKGFHPQLITVPGLPAYFFSIPELPQQNITDTDRMFDMNPQLSPASIVLANCQ